LSGDPQHYWHGPREETINNFPLRCLPFHKLLLFPYFKYILSLGVCEPVMRSLVKVLTFCRFFCVPTATYWQLLDILHGLVKNVDSGVHAVFFFETAIYPGDGLRALSMDLECEGREAGRGALGNRLMLRSASVHSDWCGECISCKI